MAATAGLGLLTGVALDLPYWHNVKNYMNEDGTEKDTWLNRKVFNTRLGKIAQRGLLAAGGLMAVIGIMGNADHIPGTAGAAFFALDTIALEMMRSTFLVNAEDEDPEETLRVSVEDVESGDLREEVHTKEDMLNELHDELTRLEQTGRETNNLQAQVEAAKLREAAN
jgi:NADPH:quinone reductase-like Zn-dependent oxidoreductase